MEFAQDAIDTTNSYLDTVYSTLTGPNLIGTFVSMCLVVYGGLAGPKLPKFFKRLFENEYFKFLILSLVAYGSVKDFKLSLLLAFAFTLSVVMFDNRYMNECFQELEKNKEQFSGLENDDYSENKYSNYEDVDSIDSYDDSQIEQFTEIDDESTEPTEITEDTEELIEEEIDGVNYLISGTEDGDSIFEILEDGTRGDLVGEYMDGEPIFS
mgnify:CR=1 FL=1